jgi:hypothetical protein
MTLGRLFYLSYSAPLGLLRRSLREGGPVAQWKTEQGRRAMEAAAQTLPVASTRAPAAEEKPLREIHVLTGQRFWYQSAFCVGSLLAHAAQETRFTLRPVFYDDGTLRGASRDQLAALFPNAKLVSIEQTRERLQQFLPLQEFPALRDRWEKYAHIRKLIDPHLGANGWKVVLDSDMLFFRRPQFLLDWLAAPELPCHMVDIGDAYGYPPPLLEELAGAALPALLNVGICGLRGEELDWERLESWIVALQSRGGTSYYLEQALVAMMLAGRTCAVAPVRDYITYPDQDEVEKCTAVLHHYVAESKIAYFRHCWRVALDRWGSIRPQSVNSR